MLQSRVGMGATDCQPQTESQLTMRVFDRGFPLAATASLSSRVSSTVMPSLNDSGEQRDGVRSEKGQPACSPVRANTLSHTRAHTQLTQPLLVVCSLCVRYALLRRCDG